MKFKFFKTCIFIGIVIFSHWQIVYAEPDSNNLHPAAISTKTTIQTKKQFIENHYIYYNEMGEGTPILLVHGLFANKEQWNALMPLLANQHYHVIVPDVPGYGKSLGYPLKDYDLDREVELLHEFMQKLGIKKFDIAGNSMGGALAALYGQKYPKQIISVAFMGAPLGVISPKPSETDELFKKGLNPFVVTNQADFNRILGLIFIHPPMLDQKVIQRKIQENIAKKAILEKITNIVLRYRNLFEKPINIQVPVLIIWGAKDKIFDVSGAELLHHKLKTSFLAILPGMGHMPQMEAAKETAYIYLNFLRTSAK